MICFYCKTCWRPLSYHHERKSVLKYVALNFSNSLFNFHTSWDCILSQWIACYIALPKVYVQNGETSESMNLSNTRNIFDIINRLLKVAPLSTCTLYKRDDTKISRQYFSNMGIKVRIWRTDIPEFINEVSSQYKGK